MSYNLKTPYGIYSGEWVKEKTEVLKNKGKHLGTVDQNNTPASGDVAINLVVRNYHTSVASEPGREAIWLHEQKVGCHANEI